MKKEKITYHFAELPQGTGPNAQILICPHCGEQINRIDLEVYLRCPYCDYVLEMNRQLEEYMLKPALMEWFHDSIQKTPYSENN